ncbi:PilZ domain-containing protein [Kineococcus sp. TRM81007]|uniref:PilZ domain-containing protein n=1 Tax=Kineococcus sp. TRM81007 TaxID=2925831 RepID=UPI001F592FE8|nr:PilZ domain-containing protein [Kineococcus sp. TRM81007]MCI2240591.1 PilZ domain-containing protein [Kineococcus sp. TRM81007]
MSSTSPAQWPAVNGRVRVQVQLPEALGGDLLELPTRVEDSAEGSLVVAAPGFSGDLHLVAPGMPVTVLWASERGQMRQDFLIAEVVRRRVPSWDLAPCGEVEVQQRRRFVRVPVTGNLRLHAVPGDPVRQDPDAAPEPAVTAAFVDLSEGGACVRVRSDAWPEAGRLVRTVFELDGGPVEQLAEVVRLVPDPAGTGEHDDLVLSFVEPVAASDRLRRHVMQEQIRNRRREAP